MRTGSCFVTSLRSLLCAALCVGAAACGARNGLESFGTEGAGGEGEAGSTSGATTSSSGGGGVGGAGGGAPACVELRWAGEPVFLSADFGGEFEDPKLIRVGSTEWALVVTSRTGDSRLVASALIASPFASWPPELSALDAHDATNAPYATSAGEPRRFAYTTSQPDGVAGRRLMQAEPGVNGASGSTYDRPKQPALALARSPQGRFAAARGAASTGVTVDFVDLSPAGPTVTSSAPLGCADRTQFAALVPSPDGAFLLASTTDESLESCSGTPAGIPRAVHLHELRPGESTPRAAIALESEVRALSLVPRPGGSILGLASMNRFDQMIHSVQLVDPAGQLVATPWTLVTGEHAAQHALAPLYEGFAFATVDAPSGASGAVELFVAPDALDFATSTGRSTAELGLITSSPPTLGTLDGGASILVAFVDASSLVPTLVVLRADCAPLGGD